MSDKAETAVETRQIFSSSPGDIRYFEGDGSYVYKSRDGVLHTATTK